MLLCRNNATIKAHVKTQNQVKHRVWHTDLWPDPTWPKSLTRWPVTWFHLCTVLQTLLCLEKLLHSRINDLISSEICTLSTSWTVESQWQLVTAYTISALTLLVGRQEKPLNKTTPTIPKHKLLWPWTSLAQLWKYWPPVNQESEAELA